MNIQFRVDRPHCDVSGTYESFFKKADYAVVFEHPATDKKCIHLHGYYFGYDSKFKSFGAQVKKVFSLKPNDYETSQTAGKDKRAIDLSGSWAYGSRFGTLRPIYTKNISPATVEDLQRYSQIFGEPILAARNSKLPKLIPIKDQKPESKAFYDICEAVLQEAKETPGLYENRLITETIDGYEVVQVKQVCTHPKRLYGILLQHLKKHRIMTEVNQLTRFMSTIIREDDHLGKSLREAVFSRLNI